MRVPANLEPEDFIVPLGQGRNTVDIVGYLTATLTEQFNPANSDGSLPEVKFAEDQGIIDFSDADQVVISEVPGSRTRKSDITTGYGFVTERVVLSVDMHTQGDRAHATRFFSEVERVFMAHRIDTVPIAGGLTGRIWMEWGIRGKSFDSTTKGGIYRRQADVRVNHVFRQVLT